jgi:FtsP/CotA-like multicopper oxidase with cupredoxin domain
MNRRSFLLGSAGLAAAGYAAGLAPWPLRRALAAPARTLTIGRREIEVNFQSASVFGITQADGTAGITLDPGERFLVDLVNDVGEDTIIHWHGQRAPYLQDGVADRNVPLLAAGKSQSYNFRPTPGTHWMHSHHGTQEQLLLAAPLIVRSEEDAKADIQEVTVLLHDFSFRDPQEILAGLTGGSGDGMHDHGSHDHAGMDQSGMGAMPGMDHSAMGHSDMGAMGGGGMGGGMGMMMDLNDVQYDAFLANDRTLDDPFVAQVERHGKVRLRLINGASSSAFWIDLGNVDGTLVAVDGNPVEPVTARRFPMAIAQRLDLIVDVTAEGAYPVFAQVEGKRERTGIVLATPGAKIGVLSERAEAEAPPVDLSLETKLRPLQPLAARPADQKLVMTLTGAMMPYLWSINDQQWPEVERPLLREGQRVVIEMQNRTMMAHPMHLHGHSFQVTALNGREIAGAVRDTVLVPINGSVTIAFDADNPGRWPFHCHNLYHMVTGMMTELVYETFV